MSLGNLSNVNNICSAKLISNDLSYFIYPIVTINNSCYPCSKLLLFGQLIVNLDKWFRLVIDSLK